MKCFQGTILAGFSIGHFVVDLGLYDQLGGLRIVIRVVSGRRQKLFPCMNYKPLKPKFPNSNMLLLIKKNQLRFDFDEFHLYHSMVTNIIIVVLYHYLLVLTFIPTLDKTNTIFVINTLILSYFICNPFTQSQ